MGVSNFDQIAVGDVTAEEMVQRVIVLGMTLGTAGQIYATIPFGCTIDSVQTSISEALTTADEVLTVKNAAGSSAGTITITQAASAAGDQDSLTPASNNVFVAGDNIEIETDGGNATAAICMVTLVLTLT